MLDLMCIQLETESSIRSSLDD